MKKIFIAAVIIAMVSGFSLQAHSALYNRGTDSLGNSLIYDSDLDITWYDYSHPLALWQEQVDWANALDVDFDGTHYTDWRLPTTVDGPYVGGYDGTTTGGYNVTSSEMGHLFYTELGNIAYYATDGTSPQPGWGLSSTGDFQNLEPYYYWAGPENANPRPDSAWSFSFNYGLQYARYKSYSYYALAVRPGDVTAGMTAAGAIAPEPVSSILFLTGISTFGIRRLWKKRHFLPPSS
ncbi:MAG: hypothetical protein HZA16_00045 [Nitrospirae bacterium]|nr:hypothetical protein [Nitrospirota bacterium]